MDAGIENIVISCLADKRRVDRLCYELQSKKRRKCIWGFSYTMFRTDYCENIEANESSTRNITQTLVSMGAPQTCYVFSIDQSIDGLVLPLQTAVESVLGNGPALLSCIHGKLAFLECEYEMGTADRYIIHEGLI